MDCRHTAAPLESNVQSEGGITKRDRAARCALGSGCLRCHRFPWHDQLGLCKQRVCARKPRVSGAFSHSTKAPHAGRRHRRVQHYVGRVYTPRSMTPFAPWTVMVIDAWPARLLPLLLLPLRRFDMAALPLRCPLGQPVHPRTAAHNTFRCLVWFVATEGGSGARLAAWRDTATGCGETHL